MSGNRAGPAGRSAVHRATETGGPLAMSNESGVVGTYVLGIAEDVASTKRLITVFRITHWVFFLVAVCAIAKFGHLYLTRGEVYSEPPEKVIEVLQLANNSMLWLFVSGVALVSG